jgi:hypothetical protein
VLLDLFMGCSSGGAAVDDGYGRQKIVHFRTLDWGMPALRRVVIQLDFVEHSDGPIVASSITYAGFVGVLTGVRKGLSMSLNFRPTHNGKGRLFSDALYWWHLTLVLLGWRRSIASVLRAFLLSSDGSGSRRDSSQRASQPSTYEQIIARVRSKRTSASTACYLCFCSGSEASVVEKDRVTAIVRSSNDFVVVTNSDDEPESGMKSMVKNPTYGAILDEIIEEAVERRQCAERNWRLMQREKRRLDVADVVDLVQRYPTTNEMTHFACVMDPDDGRVVWCRRWKRPVGARWIREHT